MPINRAEFYKRFERRFIEGFVQKKLHLKPDIRDCHKFAFSLLFEELKPFANPGNHARLQEVLDDLSEIEELDYRRRREGMTSAPPHVESLLSRIHLKGVAVLLPKIASGGKVRGVSLGLKQLKLLRDELMGRAFSPQPIALTRKYLAGIYSLAMDHRLRPLLPPDAYAAVLHAMNKFAHEVDIVSLAIHFKSGGEVGES